MILAGGISSRMKTSIARNVRHDRRIREEASVKSKSMIAVGEGNRPFLDYLLYDAKKADYVDILIVVSERDSSIQEHYGKQKRENMFNGLRISYAVQMIPTGRAKPLGTADAVLQGLKTRRDWEGLKFTVCNSDNLYSMHAFRLLLEDNHPNAMIDYDRRALQFSQERIAQFSVTRKDKENYLVDIIEKPGEEEIASVTSKDGYVGVSMNIFRLDYDMVYPFIENAPMHPTRHEKELPTALKMMIDQHPRSLYAYPLAEHVPDMTSIDDVAGVSKLLAKEFKDLMW